MDTELARLKNEIAEEIAAKRSDLAFVTEDLYEHPEVGGQEFHALEVLSAMLEKEGFAVRWGVADLLTAFVGGATAAGAFEPTRTGQALTVQGAPEPRVGIVFEYDALPNLGHACGHNASAAASMGACLGLAAVLRRNHLPGTCVALGTPAEENGGGKLVMAEAGVFEGIRAAMMVHAFDRWAVDVRAMAMDAVRFTFHGRAAHAVRAHLGVNALDAVILTFNAVNALRQQMLESSRIHGIVSRGGDAPNIVPDHAEAQFYVRALESEYLAELTRRVEDCARGAALATGCTVDIDYFEPHYDHMSSSPALVELFRANLARRVGEDAIEVDPYPVSSTDMGNLSRIVPAIHPLMPVAPPGVLPHMREFGVETIGERALDAIEVAAYAMACTALDLMVGGALA